MISAGEQGPRPAAGGERASPAPDGSVATKTDTPRAEAVVDLDAIAANVRAIRARVGPAEVLAVVKADGYGHGILPAARAAQAGGASWLGTAFVEEALTLRAAGIEGRILTWLAAPGERWGEALAADIDISVGSVEVLADVVRAAAATPRTARLHLEADTGLSRGGATAADWPELVTAALRAQAAGSVRVVGLWSHLACADEPEHPSNARALARFQSALARAEKMGVTPEVRHLANSAAALELPATRYDLVRAGIAVYGLSPAPALGGPERYGLRPAMSLRARLAQVKRIAEGEAVSYGHTETMREDTSVGVLPLGYGDGVPRHVSSAGPVLAAGGRARIVGRVCMDQVVIGLGQRRDVAAGDEVVLFGSGEDGEPTAQDWADAAGTLNYEIVTRIGRRIPRTYIGTGTHIGTGTGSNVGAGGPA